MTILLGDCLEHMKKLPDNSVDLLFCDLPYNQTSCHWDCLVDLTLFWKEVNRVCKITTPMFFCCSTKFGVSLINSNPKNFRYDMVWVKSSPCGFLNAKKMPMKKHELLYCFYRKLPLYDISSHKHKFLTPTQRDVNDTEESVYGKLNRPDCKERQSCPNYDPPLPTTVLREDCDSLYGKETGKVFIYDETGKLRNSEPRYDPPLPTTVLRETDDEECYSGDITYNYKDRDGPIYDPPLPHSVLEIKSEKRKHPTQKPVALIEWCLKYYSAEGNTVLDPTAGSGTTAIACINMNRKYICIEKDPEIFKGMDERIKERLA